MSLHICSTCSKSFKSNKAFNEHACVKKAMAKPRDQLLKDLLASGGCSQKFYDEQMALLSKGTK